MRGIFQFPFLEVFIERAGKSVDETNSIQHEVNPEKPNEANTGEKSLSSNSKLSVNEQIKVRRSSNESTTSAYRRRHTFGEKFFRTKHTQSKGNPYVFLKYISALFRNRDYQS